MTEEPDLNELMRACAGGDQNAFRALATRLGGRMFALAYRLMGQNRAAAEDAVQDALIKLWTSAPRFQPTGRVEAYASTIVHHCCMDLHRKNHGQTYELDEEAPAAAPTREDTMYAQQRHSMLMDGIETLPERQRTALLLAYFGENSNKEIATYLKVSEGAVESLLVRARRTLAHVLSSELKEGGWS